MKSKTEEEFRSWKLFFFFFLNCIYLAPITWYSSLCYSCRWRRAASFYFPLLNKQNQESFVPSLLTLKSKTALSLTLALHKKKNKKLNTTNRVKPQLLGNRYNWKSSQYAPYLPFRFHKGRMLKTIWKKNKVREGRWLFLCVQWLYA